MDKVKIVGQYYDEETDEMEWLINSDTPQPAISIRVDDYFYLRIHPETGEIVGATIFNASEWFAKNCPYSPHYPIHKKLLWAFREFKEALVHAFTPKSLNDPEVRDYVEKELKSLVPRYA